MFSGRQFESMIADMGITHVIWVPDSTTGPWESALEQSSRVRLVRICREGEAWPLAAGLHLGGRNPLVVMQSTGLFESGDALRNVAFDLRIPVFALIGIRNWLIPDSTDTARRFALPIIDAWGIDVRWIRRAEDASVLKEHYQRCRSARCPGFVLLAEGKG